MDPATSSEKGRRVAAEPAKLVRAKPGRADNGPPQDGNLRYLAERMAGVAPDLTTSLVSRSTTVSSRRRSAMHRGVRPRASLGSRGTPFSARRRLPWALTSVALRAPSVSAQTVRT